VKLISY